ncbi:MAG TPA: FAD-binding oxidoreductase [Steroidobacteraceae bacterium]|jgi:FAD/FMN-containing dehydrogenase|nr:FAD-binding oxidoreductase [Steroidobacteraceae bacterium]
MKRREFVAASLAALGASGFSFRARAAIPDELPILSRTGKPLLLTRAEVEELRAGLHGALLLNGDTGYEQARRIWNGAFDRHPAAIVRCANATDVVDAVQFARSHDLLVAVRGGGHSLPGHSVCEGGLMIDLAPLQGVQVDPGARTVRVDPGVWLGTMDRELQKSGFIVPAGTVSHTGVAGLSLGGGIGRLARKFGLSIDSLVGANLVTPDGKLRKVDAQENPDLFWAIRGGGGNFGVVTSFEFRLHELRSKPIGGDLVFPIDQARGVLDFLADFAERAADELWMDPVLECDAQGTRQLMLNICHCGTTQAAQRDIELLRKAGKAIRDNVGTRPFVTLQSEHDGDSPRGRSYYMNGAGVLKLEPALLDHAIRSIQEPGAELGKVSLTQTGGAITRVAPDATAFANWVAPFNVVVRASWEEADKAVARTAWQKATWKGFEPFARGIYANLNLADADPKLIAAYGLNMKRLVDLKTQYDPTNLFHLNPNIPPRAA